MRNLGPYFSDLYILMSLVGLSWMSPPPPPNTVRFLVMKALNTKLFPGQQWDLTHQHRISVSQTSCGWVQFADIIMIGIQHAGAHISVSLSLALFFVCFLSLLQNTKIKWLLVFFFHVKSEYSNQSMQEKFSHSLLYRNVFFKGRQQLSVSPTLKDKWSVASNTACLTI